MPLIKLVAPGPEVAEQTPHLPEIRLKPLAAWAALCSVRTRMCRMEERERAS